MLDEITDKASLDAVTKQAKATPTFIYIHNSSIPVCKNFTPVFEQYTQDASNRTIRFCTMDYSNTTSALMKFAPNQMPVLIAMVGERWCRSILGADRKALEGLLKDLKDQAEALKL